MTLIENPDGTVDFTTPPESTPIKEQEAEEEEAGDFQFMQNGIVQNGIFLTENGDAIMTTGAYAVYDLDGNLAATGANINFIKAEDVTDDMYFEEAVNAKTFESVLPLSEDDYEFYDEQLSSDPSPQPSPPPPIIQMAETGVTADNMTAPLLVPADDNGDYNYDTYTLSSATNRGTMTARRQLIYAPPMQLKLVSPRMVGTNFIFNFLTVSNQSYTVWASTNLTTTNWVSTTNLLGDGYIQKLTAPINNRSNSFYRLSSP